MGRSRNKPIDAIDAKRIAASTRFGLKLFREIANQDSGNNVFLSPLSVYLALTMLYNGAHGETQQAMADTLEWGGIELDSVNRSVAALVATLQKPGPGVQLTIANALWVNAQVVSRFEPAFVEAIKTFHDARLEALNFADPSTPSTINAWVRKQTNRKISKVVHSVDPLAMLLLTNAIYFKGKWATVFEERLTEDRPFTLLDGTQIKHPMMSQSDEYLYLKGRRFQAVSLPYSGKRLSMYIFLPDEDTSLAAFQELITAGRWQRWMSRFRKKRGHIVLPRFKLEYEVILRPALIALGMGLAFDKTQADFARLCEPPPQVWLDEALHKTFVEVNEQGTEAAAITAMMVLAKGLGGRVPKPFEMIVDRPFFCAIRDNETGAVLFIGSIVEPK